MAKKVKVNAKCTRDYSGTDDASGYDCSGVPKEIKIPKDFKGVLQLNVQTVKDAETTTVDVSLTAIQNQITEVQVGLQNLQAQLAQLLAAQQTAQSLLLVSTLGGGAENSAERQEMIRQMISELRTQSNGQT